MAAVAGMGVSGGLGNSCYPQHIDLDEGGQWVSMVRDDPE